MSYFWPAVGLAALVLVAAVPAAIGFGALLNRSMHSRRFAWWFALAFTLAFAYAVTVTAGAAWLAWKWGIK